jgi:leader peptidase (prepilin peptidase)/N-methyltransferase
MRQGWHRSILPLLALYALTAVWSRPAPAQAVFLSLLAIPLIVASLADLRAQVIPDWTSIAVAGLGLAAPVFGGRFPELPTLTVAAGLTGVLALGGEIYWRRTGQEALGLGDVKLIGAGTLVVSADRVWSMLLIASVGGIAAVLLSGKRMGQPIPFGPFLAYSVFATTALLGAG